MKHDVLSQQGTKVGDIELNSAVFGIEPHKQAMFDAIIAQQSSLRQGTHKTKTRTEVRGGGRKPWKQKGTGRARQGSIRAPQWKGGGIAFGPTTEKNYIKHVNKKVRKLALKSVLSAKVKSGNLIILDDLVMEKPSTKAALHLLNTLHITGQKVLVMTPELNENIFRSLSNLRFADFEVVSGMNILDLVHYTNLVVTKSAVKAIEEALA